jgi:hypothetical protein
MNPRRTGLLPLLLALAAPAAAQPRPAAPTTPTAPAATAPAAEAPAEAAPEGDVDALRQEYLALRDRLFRSRARAAAVESALYSSRLSIVLGYGTGRQQAVGRASIRLDGASVYDDVDGAIGKGPATRFEGYVAPGRHLISIRVEATSRDDDRFTTATESTFVVLVPTGKDVVVTAKAEDDGDLGYAWKKDEKGGYRLGLDVDVKTKARPGRATSTRGGSADGGRRAAR